MSEKLKLIIDMDIGDDIDDAIALYAAMRQGFEIVGVTTTFRNTLERARMSKKLLKSYGKGYENVPVYTGHGIPLAEEFRPVHHTPHYTPDLEEDIYTPDGINPDDAVDFIIDACHKYGKELAIVALGAFTNMARVIQKDPEALNLCAKVAIMGGAFFKQYADWNVICDVEAADIMFRNVKQLECIGADVTHLMVGDQALYDNLLEYEGDEPGHKYLTELCRLWRKDRPTCKLLLHDPLVIYYVADPSICTMVPQTVAVMTDGYGRGTTFNIDAYGKKRYNPKGYDNFDLNSKVLVASAGNREEFNARILKDFTV